MPYEQTRKKIEDAGATWNAFIAYMEDKSYDVDPNTHYILYPRKHITRFLKKHAKTKRTGA